MSKLESVLKGIVKLGIDTAPIIYFVETNPQYYTLQVSAALATGCQAFLTNDISLKKITELPILVLEDLK